MTFSAGHGTQVEYLAADGRSFLWYPGNQVVLRGAWRRAPSAAGGEPGICFRYGHETYNPVTGAAGGGWDCEPLAVYRRGLVDAAPGDIFGLSRTVAAPFLLHREQTNLAVLRARLQ